MLVITAVNTPLITLLYKPSVRYVTQKRRTIQHLKHDSELCILACVHGEDHVASILDLLEASHASRESPISLTLLHLTELAGRAAAVLRPYKRSHRLSNNPTTSDRIVNAFRYFEQHSPPDAVSLNALLAIAPYSTMHNDICSVALDCKVSLILLPFHKHSDGAQHTTNQSYQSINRNVLAFAPCSVAILVDHGLHVGTTCARTNNLLHHIAVYFLGGADDREALAYAARMIKSQSINLTVICFLPHEGASNCDEERKLDEAMLKEFRHRHTQNDKVEYIEKVVENGEGTAAVIQATSQKFDLLIVGRRMGVESVLTSGLSEWSEFPELGIIGDMLASTEFGIKVSILVVQQQLKVAGEVDLTEIDGHRLNTNRPREEMRDLLIGR